MNIYRHPMGDPENPFEGVKDWDFAVESESFDTMREWMLEQGFEIFVETPQYFTIRARTPKDGFSFAGVDMSGKTFDFALCRTESDYTDGRHPDKVEVGTIYTDLSRRDFTMNAIALKDDSELIDPYEGQGDIFQCRINCVGGVERLEEDALRILRAIRFAVQLNFQPTKEITDFIRDPEKLKLLNNISQERIQSELRKAFNIDTLETLWWLEQLPELKQIAFGGNMWLEPTVKGR